MAALWSGINCTRNDDQQNNFTFYTFTKCEEDYYVTDVQPPNLWCLLLAFFPATCVFGNSLVVLAVLSEKSLQTSTNFLLVSLAVADMLVAILVMPFAIYLTVNRLRWFLPGAVCNFFCVADVTASTASIVHLVSISIDRFYAVVKHVEYKTTRHKSRILGTILFCWIFSIAIGFPLGMGLNEGDTKGTNHCGIINSYYMLYSSIFAFYIPCLVMIVMYSFVFYQLKKRLRVVRLQEMAAAQMVNFGDNLGKIMEGAGGDADLYRRNTMTWAMPFLKTIEQTIATMADNEDVSLDEIDELTTILHTLETDQRLLSSPPSSSSLDRRSKSLMENDSVVSDEMIGNQLKKRFSSLGLVSKRSSIYVAKQKIKTLKNRALELLMRIKSKQGLAIRKETRATKLVATVMLVFLLCYMPFFTTNIVKVFKLRNDTWTEDLEQAFIVFTWFGYFNSCLNPVIYSLFNRKLRAAFRKLLHCSNQKQLVVFTRRNNNRLCSMPRKNDEANDDPLTADFEYRLSLLKNATEQLKRDRYTRVSVVKSAIPTLDPVVENESEPTDSQSSFVNCRSARPLTSKNSNEIIRKNACYESPCSHDDVTLSDDNSSTSHEDKSDSRNDHLVISDFIDTIDE